MSAPWYPEKIMVSAIALLDNHGNVVAEKEFTGWPLTFDNLPRCTVANAHIITTDGVRIPYNLDATVDIRGGFLRARDTVVLYQPFVRTEWT